MNNYNIFDLLHYLDDYVTLGLPNSDTCATRLQAIDHATSLIGIPLSPDKCAGPTTWVRWKTRTYGQRTTRRIADCGQRTRKLDISFHVRFFHFSGKRGHLIKCSENA